MRRPERGRTQALSQLALPLRLADYAVFATFLASGNEPVVAHLRALAGGAGGPGCWLWGGPSTGKTHLLQAVCDAAGDRSAYVPMRLLADAGPAMLDGLASRELVCIDDIGYAAGFADWEQALFRLCNELTESGGRLIASADTAQRECRIDLADLKSRLSSLPTFHLRALDDADRGRALQLRAAHRGLKLPDETASYMIRRSRRDMASLYELLDRLDVESLRAQRRLTVALVRDILRGQGVGPE